MRKLKKYFVTGILIWLPLGLTVWIINISINFLNQLLPHQTSEWIFGRHIPGASIAIALVTIIITGIITTNIIGQKIFNYGEQILFQIPIVKSIYKGIKQVSDTLLSSQGNAFRKALLVRFPHNDTWSIAFITGNPNGIIENHQEYVNVYIPTTPNPTSGYFIIVKKIDTREINLTVDQALRYVISMGTVDPRNFNNTKEGIPNAKK